MSGKWEKAAWSALSLNIVLTFFCFAHLWSPIVDLKSDPVHRTMGGEVLAGAVMGWDDTIILTERYQEAAWIQFYGQVEANVFPDQGRMTQFDIWTVVLPEKGLLVRPKTSHAPPYLKKAGFSITDVQTVYHDEESKSGKSQTPHTWDVIHFERAKD